MSDLRSLRRELAGAFAIVSAGVLLAAGLVILMAQARLAPQALLILGIVLLPAVVAAAAWLGPRLLGARLATPLTELGDSLDGIAAGALDRRAPEPGLAELQRLSTSINTLAERMSVDREQLTQNIRSLDETNRLLTEARDAMIRSEKMASVGRLGAGIAHEVGNPLGAVMGYLALIGRQEDGPRREMVLAAEKEAQRIDRIVRGLLDFARPREATAAPIDVNDVIRDTLDLVRTQGHFSRVRVEFEPVAAPLVVRGDRYQLQQVLVNLLVNAADALEDTSNGAVTVSAARRAVLPAPAHTPARRRDDPEGIDYSHRRRLAATPRWPLGDPESESGDVVEIIVADNGPGLPKDLIEQVFEPFVTTKEPGKGTGLGLAVCARLIEGMGGLIRAGNATGGGAVFRVILPAMAAEVATP
jgi:two-component system, NtrC family, sensor kinase